MTATIIDGKAFADTVREKVATHVARLKDEDGITPGLAVVLVGEDPASQVYVRSKGKQTVEAGSFQGRDGQHTAPVLRLKAGQQPVDSRAVRVHVRFVGGYHKGLSGHVVAERLDFAAQYGKCLRGRDLGVS